MNPEYVGRCGRIETREYPPRTVEVNTRLPGGEQWPMLGRVASIYRTEISARDIV
jgi:hypothetical protein